MSITYSASDYFSDAGGSVNESFTVPTTGANRVLLVGVSIRDATGDNDTIATITYGGDSLTSLHSVGYNDQSQLEIYYLLAPPTGPNTLVVTTTETDEYLGVLAIVYEGIDPNNPFGTIVQDQAADVEATVSSTVTSAAGELVMDFVIARDQIYGDISEDPSQTKREHGNDGGPSSTDITLAASEQGGSATVQMLWNKGTSNREIASQAAVPLRPASGGRQLRTRYHTNTGVNAALGRSIVIDTLGRIVPLEQIKTDEWIHTGGAFFPTTRRFSNLVEDRSRGYIEAKSVSGVNTENPRGRISVRKESQFDFLLRRLTGAGI